MQFKLALSTAILGTITVAIASAPTRLFAGYANTSSPLADTQALTCPALTGETPTAIELAEQSLALAEATDTATANQILAITAFCNGYGYGGATAANPAALNSTTPAESGSFLYIDTSPAVQTPQAAAKFDQLPQDRIEFKAPL